MFASNVLKNKQLVGHLVALVAMVTQAALNRVAAQDAVFPRCAVDCHLQ